MRRMQTANAGVLVQHHCSRGIGPTVIGQNRILEFRSCCCPSEHGGICTRMTTGVVQSGSC